MRLIHFVTSILVVGIHTGFCQEVDSTTYANMRHGKCKNGLLYYIVKSNEPSNLISIQFIERAGNYVERGNELGISHLIEHLGMRSTRNFPNGMARRFQTLGLKYGLNINASTNFTTVYQIVIPSQDSLMLATAFLSLHDWANGLSFLPNEVDEERAAVLNEVAMAQDSTFIAMKTSQFLLLDSRDEYAYKMDSVAMLNVRSNTIESMKKFYKTWYSPDRQGIVIVGDIDEFELEEKVISEFSDLKSNGLKMLSIDSIFNEFDAPLTGKNKLVIVNHGSENRKIAIQIFNKRKSNVEDEMNRKARVADAIYNLLMDARLRRLNGAGEIPWLCHLVSRGVIHPFSGIDALSTYIQVDKYDEVRSAIETAAKELYRVERWGFSEEELCRAKEGLKVIEQERKKGTDLSKITNSLENAFNETITPYFVSNRMVERIINEISLEEINDFSQKWLSSLNNTDILLSLPDTSGARLFKEDEVFSWFNDVRKSDIRPYSEYKVKSLPEPLIKKKDKGYVIKSHEDANVTELFLSNGVHVVLRQIKSQQRQPPSIVLKGFGTVNPVRRLGYDDFAATQAAQVVTKSGVMMFSVSEFDDWRRKKNTNGYFGVGTAIRNGEIGFTGSASPNNFDELLRMIYYYYTSPQSNKEVFLTQRKELMEKAKHSNGANNIFEDSINATLGLRIGANQNQHQLVKFDDVIKVYKSYLNNVQNLTFVIVGQFEMNQVKESTVKYLGALPMARNVTKAKKEQFVELKRLEFGVSNTTSNRKVHIVKDSTGNERIRLIFPIKSLSKEAEQLNLMVLSEIIQGSLHARLREREKAVYYVHSWLRSNSDGNNCFVEVEFEALPSKTDHLIAATLEEISRISNGYLDENYFFSGLKSVTQRLKNEQKNLGVCADMLIGQIRNGVSLDPTLREKNITKVTVSSVQNAARDLFDAQNYFLFTLF